MRKLDINVAFCSSYTDHFLQVFWSNRWVQKGIWAGAACPAEVI